MDFTFSTFSLDIVFDVNSEISIAHDVYFFSFRLVRQTPSELVFLFVWNWRRKRRFKVFENHVLKRHYQQNCFTILRRWGNLICWFISRRILILKAKKKAAMYERSFFSFSKTRVNEGSESRQIYWRIEDSSRLWSNLNFLQRPAALRSKSRSLLVSLWRVIFIRIAKSLSWFQQAPHRVDLQLTISHFRPLNSSLHFKSE